MYVVFSFSTALFILWPLSKSSACQTGSIKPGAHAAVQHNEKLPQTKVITQVLHKYCEMNFTSGVHKWNKRLEEKSRCPMETMQRSEHSLCLIDFWTTATPESHLSKLKCEKINRKSTLCKTWGHTRSVLSFRSRTAGPVIYRQCLLMFLIARVEITCILHSSSM